MKAVILECRDGYCAVLKDDGTIEKIRMHGIVGQEIDMPAVRGKTRVQKFPIRRVAAAAVALVAMAAGALSQIQEYSYVSVDVDASVEYSLNRMDRVIKVKPLNKKGEELAATMKKAGVTGSTFDKAVKKTAAVLQEDGYVASTDSGVIVAVSSRSEKKSDNLAKVAADVLVNDDVKTAVETISMEDRKEARDSGISAGRYAVTKDITGSDDLDEATIDISKNKSAGELLQIAEEMDVEDGTQPEVEPNETVIEDDQTAAFGEDSLEVPLEPSSDELVTVDSIIEEALPADPASDNTETTEESNIPATGVTPADANKDSDSADSADADNAGDTDKSGADKVSGTDKASEALDNAASAEEQEPVDSDLTNKSKDKKSADDTALEEAIN